jgi:hypothetical protein
MDFEAFGRKKSLVELVSLDSKKHDTTNWGTVFNSIHHQLFTSNMPYFVNPVGIDEDMIKRYVKYQEVEDKKEEH